MAGGDPNQTIQVSARRGQGRRGRDGAGRGAPSPGPPRPRRIGLGLRNSSPTWAGSAPAGPKPPRSAPTPRFHISGDERDPDAAIEARQRTARPFGDPGRRWQAERRWRPVPGGRESRDPGEAGLGGLRLRPAGRGWAAPPSPGTGWNLLAWGWDCDGRDGPGRRRRCPQRRVEAAPSGGLGTEWDPQGGGALRTAGVLPGDASREQRCSPWAAVSLRR